MKTSALFVESQVRLVEYMYQGKETPWILQHAALQGLRCKGQKRIGHSDCPGMQIAAKTCS